MTNYISYSLYGSDPKYLIGALRNCESVAQYYPNWIPVFFVGVTVPHATTTALRSLGARIETVHEQENAAAMFWRYRAVYFEDSDRVIFRDADSRLSLREARLVSEWCRTGKDLHIIRDHPNHTSAILGGLWGCKSSAIREKLIYLEAQLVHLEASYGLDQEVIRAGIYRDRRYSRVIHDSIFVRELSSLNPQLHSSNDAFLGEVYSEFDFPDPGGRAALRRYRTSRIFRFKIQMASVKNIVLDFGLDAKRRLIQGSR